MLKIAPNYKIRRFVGQISSQKAAVIDDNENSGPLVFRIPNRVCMRRGLIGGVFFLILSNSSGGGWRTAW